MMDDLISRHDAIDALWKALYEYEDKTEKQFQESEDLDVGDWILHRVFVQNMSDIDRQTILNLPSAQPEQKKGRWAPGRKIGKEILTDGTIAVVYEDYKCSSCGLILYRLLHNSDGTPFYKFCPNCGADMRERKKNDENPRWVRCVIPRQSWKRC